MSNINDNQTTSTLVDGGDAIDLGQSAPGSKVPKDFSDENSAGNRIELGPAVRSVPNDAKMNEHRTVNEFTVGDSGISPSPARQTEDAPIPEIKPATATPNRLPPIARQMTGGSGRPYSSFSSGTKWFLITLAGVSAIFSPISSNIFVPAIPVLATEFNKTEADISLAVTIYLVFQAITPSIFGSMSDTYGRRPVYILVLVIYLGANIGLALCPTSAYWLLLVLRALQATGGSAVIAIGSGTVADVAEPRERGFFMSIFQATGLIGPALGPFLGGVFAQTLGWRAIFWFLAISTGVILVPLIFLMPETLRSLVGDGSIPPPPLSMSPPMLWHRRQMKRKLARTGGEKEHVERPPRKRFQPLSAFMILFHKEIIMIFIFTSLQYTVFYCVLTVYSTALKQSYGLSELQIGLCYLPAGFGAMFASLLMGKYQDYLYNKELERVGGDHRKRPETFRLEISRFQCLWPATACLLIGATSLGWCLQVRAPLAATLVMNFLVGLGSATNGPATIYGQDIFPGKGGAVSASLNLVRCLFGAVGTAVIQHMYESPLGAGWSFVVLSGLCILGLPLPITVIRHGKEWREDREYKKEEKRLKKVAAEAERSSAGIQNTTNEGT